MTRAAALISQMDPPPGKREAFDDWYREEHVPSRLAVPGFTMATRGWAVHGEPSHLVVYELESLDVLGTAAYAEVKGNPSGRTARMLRDVAAFTRFTGEEIGDTGAADPGGRFLYLVTFAVPEEAQAEFDAWYEQDHVPALMRCRDWLRVRRYSIVDSNPEGVTRASLHELADVAALDSPERRAARESPWRARLAAHEWFATSRYAVYERTRSTSITSPGQTPLACEAPRPSSTPGQR